MCQRHHVSLINAILCAACLILMPTHGSFLNNTDGTVQVILLEEYWSSDHRVRRAADSNLPDKLSFGMFLDGSDVVLRLKRSRLLPIVTSDEFHTQQANEKLENVGVYKDLSHASAVIVERELGQYSLNGTFVHDHKEWRIERLATFMQGSRENDTFSHRIFALKTNRTRVPMSEDGISLPERKSEQRSGSNRGEKKVTHHVIEIAFVVDYIDYLRWWALVGQQEALHWMRVWYTYIADSINIRYATIKDPDISIRTIVTVLKIMTEAADSQFLIDLSDWDFNLNGSAALEAFVAWYQNQTDIPESDHYMLFTGYNLDDAAGMAYVGTLCTSESVSICENTFDGYVHIVAAHELGHSLSARHDSPYIKPYFNCSYYGQNVMAREFVLPIYPEGNPWKFSQCSLTSFKSFLSNATCTLDNTSGRTKLPSLPDGYLPGQLMNWDLQCRLSFLNKYSYFCKIEHLFEDGGLENLCSGMYCRNPGHYFYHCDLIIPQEFTSCGDEKWCVEGMCVHRNGSSTVTTSVMNTTAIPFDPSTPSTSPGVSKPLTQTLHNKTASVNLHRKFAPTTSEATTRRVPSEAWKYTKVSSVGPASKSTEADNVSPSIKATITEKTSRPNYKNSPKFIGTKKTSAESSVSPVSESTSAKRTQTSDYSLSPLPIAPTTYKPATARNTREIVTQENDSTKEIVFIDQEYSEQRETDTHSCCSTFTTTISLYTLIVILAREIINKCFI